jgi:hypothetical protein
MGTPKVTPVDPNGSAVVKAEFTDESHVAVAGSAGH